jgi:peptide/histidine transporter 3/4
LTDTEQQASAEPASFFGWFFFAVNIGALLAFTVVVYAQERFGWGAGAGIALGAMLASLLGLGLGSRVPYVCMPPSGSALTRFLRVLVAAARNHNRDCPQQLFELDDPALLYPKLPHTDSFR